MEKEPQPESITTVNMKPDYAPSEIYSSSEPPPAYHRPKSTAVQVAKIVAVTVVVVSIVLGSFLLASAYVTASASCRQLEQELELLSEAADRFQSAPLQPEALIQEDPSLVHKRHSTDPLKSEESKIDDKQIETNSIDSSSSGNSENESDDSSSGSDEDEKTIHFKLPLQLDFDDLAGALIEKNQKSKMNCVVEKKRAEQVVDHQSKTLNLPFGLNITTDPRFEKFSGERMAIFCESGNTQRKGRPEDNEDENDDDDEQETIMIQPVMIPIPHSNYPTHMAQRVEPMMSQPPQQMIQRQQSIMQPHLMMQQQVMRQQYPPHPMETMRPPMPPMGSSNQQQMPNDFPPNPILHQIAQQIIAQKIMEAQKAAEEQQHEPRHTHTPVTAQEVQEERQPAFSMPEGMVAQRLQPIPEALLSHLNRLQSDRNVIVAVAEPDDSEESPEMKPQAQQQPQMLQPQMVQPQIRIIQQQRQSPHELNGRQGYARGLPINIPVPMMRQENSEPIPIAEVREQQEPEAQQAVEESRPHYVQPRSVRSVRSVDAVFEKSQKRVKRCSCNCAC